MPFRQLSQRLRRALETPPPWFWWAPGALFQRVSSQSRARCLLELLQQLHWWLIVPLRRARHHRRLNAALPMNLRLRACWLNSYQPRELAWWWVAGVRHWEELSSKTPESLVGQLHRQRRQHWPAQCRPALELLADKAALLALTPPAWQPDFLKLEPHTPAGPTPAWWWDSIHRDGLVLKPLQGHAGRGVVRFRWREQGLDQEGLFCQLSRAAPDLPAMQAADPEALHQRWQRIIGSCEAALASPYLNHSPLLPESNPSVVVRVLTQQVEPGSSVRVALAWLEIPLTDGAVAFLGLDGQALPKPGEPFTAEQCQELSHWQEQLKGQGWPAIQACLVAAQTMHGLLPPIDQVAWDWIPAEPMPLLLEGNGGFGLLVPQLFQHLQKSSITGESRC